MKDTEIDMMADALIILLGSLMQLNSGEVTQFEFDESMKRALGTMYPLVKRRYKIAQKRINELGGQG